MYTTHHIKRQLRITNFKQKESKKPKQLAQKQKEAASVRLSQGSKTRSPSCVSPSSLRQPEGQVWLWAKSSGHGGPVLPISAPTQPRLGPAALLSARWHFQAKALRRAWAHRYRSRPGTGWLAVGVALFHSKEEQRRWETVLVLMHCCRAGGGTAPQLPTAHDH